MASVVKGKDCYFKINITGGLKLVLCSKSFTLSTVTEEVEVTTISDGSDPEEGFWRDFDYHSLGYTITLEGILKNTDSTDDTAWELNTAQRMFYEVPFTMYFVDAESNAKTIEGTAIVKSSTFGATSNAFVSTSIEFIGKGKYTIT